MPSLDKAPPSPRLTLRTYIGGSRMHNQAIRRWPPADCLRRTRTGGLEASIFCGLDIPATGRCTVQGSNDDGHSRVSPTSGCAPQDHTLLRVNWVVATAQAPVKQLSAVCARRRRSVALYRQRARFGL